MRNQLRSASGWMHRHLVFPAVIRARGEGSMFRTQRELAQLQWASGSDLARRQDEKLTRLLTHASRHSSFYADTWPETTFAEARIRGQLQGLPFILKTDLQDSQERMVVHPPPGRVSRKTTGGSTGQAVTVIKDRKAIAAERAASWLAYGWFGVRPGDKGARFWGSPVTLKRRLLYDAADIAMRRLRFSAFAFDDADLEGYWKQCIRARPHYFYGYVSMLEAMAQYVLRRGLTRTWPELKAVVTTSEVLTEPQRALLMEAFGVPVQNEYGCGEVGPIAYECEKGSLHLMSENQIVEIVTPDGRLAKPGETGEVVLTDLNNFAMPLVRYRVGDLAVPGDGCSCGRGFPVLEKVWGRAYDIVQTPDGRRYHGEFFMYLFEDLRAKGMGVDQFKVIQDAADRITVEVVYGDGRDGVSLEREVLRGFRDRLPAMQVALERVARIAPKASGKTAVVENLWINSASDTESRVADTH